MIEKIKEGSYVQHINTILSYQYRKGIIPRKRLWEIALMRLSKTETV